MGWVAATVVVLGPQGPVEGARVYAIHAPVSTLEQRFVARTPLLTDAQGRVSLPRWVEEDERLARRMVRFARRQRRQARTSFCGTWNILDPTVNAATVLVEGRVPVQAAANPGHQVEVMLEPAEPWVVDLGLDLEECTLRANLGGRHDVAGIPQLEVPTAGSEVVLPYRASFARITGTCGEKHLIASVVEDEVLVVTR